MSIALWKVVRTPSKVMLRGSKTRKPGAENPDPEDGQGASQAVGVSPRRYQDSPDAAKAHWRGNVADTRGNPHRPVRQRHA